MVQESHGMHHFHRRKRIHLKHEPYPHPNRGKRFLDEVIYAVGIIGPLLTMPQLAKVWLERNTAGLSLFSWSGYALIALIWLIYGIVHKEKPIILTNILWLAMEVMIIVGIIRFS